MKRSAVAERLRLITVEEGRRDTDFAVAVERGLTAEAKSLSCRFFYDVEGSRIFEEICALPEYYLTRTEHEILRACAGEVAGMFESPPSLVELGSGSSTKTRVLIEAFLAAHGTLRYVPVDISRSMLEESAQLLLDAYPGLEVVAIAAEYEPGLQRIRSSGSTTKLVLWLGSNLGNFTRKRAAAFLADLGRSLGAKDRLLIGIDLRKDRRILERAYNDAAGVTARFNKNLLTRINRELRGHFDLAHFHHQARYDEIAGRIDMQLLSSCPQQVLIDQLALDVGFKEGETIYTESSYKYSLDEITVLAARAGLLLERQWLDKHGWFSVSLLAPGCG